jgi:hypothetical protein
MDKINTANWADYFGEAEAKVVHASDRYTETVLEFKEPSLASGKYALLQHQAWSSRNSRCNQTNRFN